jgi:Ca-activated chloride channel family protein
MLGSNFVFEWPWMLALLPLPWLLLKTKRLASQIELKVPNIARLAILTQNSLGFLHKNKFLQAIFIISWLSLILALSGPMVVSRLTPSTISGYDLLLAVDLSHSMESSLPAVKQVVKDFVKQRQGDRVGLIVFAENAYMAIPITQDLKSVVKMIDSLMVGMAGGATSIGDAIALAAQNLQQRPESSRVLVLLTDGSDNSSHIPPMKALEIAKKDHLKIYTIGIGNQTFNDEFLKIAASQTGGLFNMATSMNDLVSIYENINKLEKTDFTLEHLQITEPYYRWFLSLSILGFMIIMAHMLQRINRVLA